MDIQPTIHIITYESKLCCVSMLRIALSLQEILFVRQFLSVYTLITSYKRVLHDTETVLFLSYSFQNLHHHKYSKHIKIQNIKHRFLPL